MIPGSNPGHAGISLKEAYQGSFLIGAALNARQYGDTDPATTAVITREFNCATAENDMKWEALEPKPNTFRFERADCRSWALCR